MRKSSITVSSEAERIFINILSQGDYKDIFLMNF